MQTAARTRAAVVLAAAAAVAGVTVIPAATGAEPRSAGELRNAAEAYAAQERSAELQLYAIETKLAASRAELSRLSVRVAAVGRRHDAAKRTAALANLHLDVADRLLAERLLALYQQGDPDPLAILLGAESIADAIDGLEGLSTLAAQDSRLAKQAREWKSRARAEARTLARQVAGLKRAESAVESRATTLAGELAARGAFLAELRAKRQLTERQVAAAEAAALAAQATSQALAPATASAAPAPSTTAAPQPAPGTPRSLTVVATGYALPGRTATGIKVGWGVVAVDPSVIPLGTKLTVPGYGAGVAADVGSAIRGARIDLWFPTQAKALAWGSRTVRITVH